MEEWRQRLLIDHLRRRLSREQLEALGGQPAAEVAREWSQYDFAFFCRYYLPRYFDKPFAPMHWELAADVEETIAAPEGRQEVVVWPRGYGKSTAVCCGLVLWVICWEKKHYCVLIKESFDQAKLELRGVKEELEHNEALRRDFGPRVGEKWDAAQIVTRPGPRFEREAGAAASGTMVEALGTGMKIRGRRHGPHRPDLIIVDDPEDLADVDSATQRGKTKRYFHRSVMKAGDEATDVFAIGTKLHSDCLVASLLETPAFRGRVYKSITEESRRQDLWEEWKLLYLNRADPQRQRTARAFFDAHAVDMLEGVKVAWPEAFPYYRLQVMRLGEEDEVGGIEIHSFAAEMQNEPLSEGERLFTEIGFYHIEHRIERAEEETWLVPDEFGTAAKLRECKLFGACDPSLGETDRADFSAVVDLLLAPTGQKFVGLADIDRRLPDVIIRAILDHAAYWQVRGLKYKTFGIESVAFQKLFKTDTAKAAMKEQRYLPLEELAALGKKYSRIASLQPDLKNKYILLLREKGEPLPREQRRLYDQLRDYPSVAHDDGPDALEMVNRLAAKGGAVLFG